MPRHAMSCKPQYPNECMFLTASRGREFDIVQLAILQSSGACTCCSTEPLTRSPICSNDDGEMLTTPDFTNTMPRGMLSFAKHRLAP
jgi:hypothetical protein